MPIVYNKRDYYPPNAIYVGRPSKWGNPYVIGKDGTRQEVIQKYRMYINNDKLLYEDCKRELKGKNLVCWCVPDDCHAYVLMEIANE